MSDDLNRKSQTTLPTEAEMDEVLGKPGPAIGEVDVASMAACVEASRQEARSQTTEMADLEIAEEQLEEWQNACRKLERMNTDLRFALEAALPGLRDLVNQECPDPDVAERDQIVLRQALKALGKSA